jgi:ADP-ribose pyrophosphatase YjhB (NUDIX family)
MTIVEPNVWEDVTMTVTWEDSPQPPPRELTAQVGGVCFTVDGDIVLVTLDNVTWNVPGGHVEEGETVARSLAREVEEEACAIVEDAVLLGSQRVDDPTKERPYYHTCFWARVRLVPFDPQFETKRRIVVKPKDFLSTLYWGDRRIAKAIFDAAMRVEQLKRTDKI